MSGSQQYDDVYTHFLSTSLNALVSGNIPFSYGPTFWTKCWIFFVILRHQKSTLKIGLLSCTCVQHEWHIKMATHKTLKKIMTAKWSISSLSGALSRFSRSWHLCDRGNNDTDLPTCVTCIVHSIGQKVWSVATQSDPGDCVWVSLHLIQQVCLPQVPYLGAQSQYTVYR